MGSAVKSAGLPLLTLARDFSSAAGGADSDAFFPGCAVALSARSPARKGDGGISAFGYGGDEELEGQAFAERARFGEDDRCGQVMRLQARHQLPSHAPSTNAPQKLAVTYSADRADRPQRPRS